MGNVLAISMVICVNVTLVGLEQIVIKVFKLLILAECEDLKKKLF